MEIKKQDASRNLDGNTAPFGQEKVFKINKVQRAHHRVDDQVYEAYIAFAECPSWHLSLKRIPIIFPFVNPLRDSYLTQIPYLLSAVNAGTGIALVIALEVGTEIDRGNPDKYVILLGVRPNFQRQNELIPHLTP